MEKLQAQYNALEAQAEKETDRTKWLALNKQMITILLEMFRLVMLDTPEDI